MNIKQKCIVQNCPAIYDYYPLNGEKQRCCYRFKGFYSGIEHMPCAEINYACTLKETIREHTFRKGTIQEKLNVEWIEDYEYRKSDKLKELWKEL